ncbi:hypothetical protein S7335_4664 [Synechococcus sp. PCC 7335]|nr:hypothetical protein S7335_4664 [Synechococcus sp. PCC 7335]
MILKHERKYWKKLVGYHRRSLAKTTMFRHKGASDGRVRSRKLDN